MTESIFTIQADFDRIALLTRKGWNHNNHYYEFLLRNKPTHSHETLEIGCGGGEFTRLLAASAGSVLALDLSPQMIRIAVERSEQFPNIEYRVADVMSEELPGNRFDCIASVATLHHLPIREALLKMKRALKVGGVLLVLDLFQAEGLMDALTSAMAIPVNVSLRFMHSGNIREPQEVREAWAEHGRHDSYPTLEAMREICAEILPGAQLRKHLLWRYSIIWKKTAA